MPVVKKVVGFDTTQEFHEVDGSETGRIATEPCAPAVASSMDARMWLCDTGCPCDLTSKKALDHEGRKMIQQADVPQVFNTANGQIRADTTVTMQIPHLMETIEPYLLPNTPDVISIGRRCVREGYGFYWPPFSEEPYFEIPEDLGGGYSVLESVDDVPYLRDTWNVDGAASQDHSACPAPIATGSAACSSNGLVAAPSAKGGGSSHSSDADSEGESDSSDGLPALLDPASSAEGESAGEGASQSSGKHRKEK